VLGGAEMDRRECGNNRGFENKSLQFSVSYLFCANCKFDVIKNKIKFGHFWDC
jgi:hypothetical protein